MTRSITTLGTRMVLAAEVDRRLQLADGALGSAGHEVADPVLREYGRRVAEGTLTAEEAIAAGMAYIDAR